MSLSTRPRSFHFAILVLTGILGGVLPPDAFGQRDASYDADAALARSQAAVGKTLKDLAFTDSSGKPVRLADFRGRPVLISLVFTSCHHVCPAITHHLHVASRSAREVLGEGSFQVLTVGFDTPVDTPEAMRAFARQQAVDDPNWAFLSGDKQNVDALMENIGFVSFPSPRGFDHINQVTIVDRQGVIYRQVYGAAFDLPWLVEPLKQLVFNRPQPGEPPGVNFLNRIKLFCTVYDPSTGRYHFDYSLFVGIGVGALIVLAIVSWLLLEAARARKAKQSGPGHA